MNITFLLTSLSSLDFGSLTEDPEDENILMNILYPFTPSGKNALDCEHVAMLALASSIY